MCEKPVQVARLSGCFSGPKVRLEDTSAGDLGHSPSAISVRPPGTSGAPNRAVQRTSRRENTPKLRPIMQLDV